jgi:hypothetical protein
MTLDRNLLMESRTAVLRRTRAMSATAAVILFLSACTSEEQVVPVPPTPAPNASGPALDDPTVAVTSDCPKPPQEPTTETSPGSGGLTASTLHMLGGGGTDLVYDKEALSQQPDVLAVKSKFDFDDQASFAQGAYAAGIGYASVVLKNDSNVQIKIDRIHPVNLVRDCIPLAAAFLGSGEEGDATSMVFNLDLAAPEARITESPEDPSPGLFFRDSTLKIPAHGSADDLGFLKFETVWGAYSFDLAIEYHINGHSYTTLLDNRGQPFRVATDLCSDPKDILGVPVAAQQRLKSLRYEHVRERATGDNFPMVDVSPDDLAARCGW